MRLWLRLFFAFASLSGLALLGFVAWQQQNFRSGFLGYLDDVAAQRLEPARERLAAAFVEHGGWDFLREDPAAFGELVEPGGMRHPGGDPLRPRLAREWHGPLPGFPDADETPPRDRDVGDPHDRPPEFRGHDPGRGPPRPHGPPDLMPRLLLLDADARPVAGNPGLPDDALSLPLTAAAKVIGSLRLARQTRISSAIDAAFSRTQTGDAALVGIAILAGALLLAFALARWLLAPVHALAAGTRALAAGDFGRRVTTARSDELGALAGDFNRLAATLEHNRAARQRWGADIAHELRTPLSVLRGEIQALQDGVRSLSPAALDSLQAECTRLGSLIEDLYQLSLADAGALDYRFEPVDLGELVRESLATQQQACQDAGLVLADALTATPPVRGDVRRLVQLIDNLLANARRYTDAPGCVRLSVASAANHALVTVDDTPPGVPADALPRLFDRLYRVDASRARESGGAGLGLSICRAIVDAHGGTIVAQHSPLGGLRIVVQLPLAEGGQR